MKKWEQQKVELIKRVYEESNQNVHEVSRRLNMHRNTILKYLRMGGIK